MTKEEESRARKAQKLVAKYHRVFTSTEGKEVLADLARSNFIHRTTFVPGDAYFSAYNEGQRAAILDIFRLLKLDPSQFLNQMNEQKEDNHVEI